jgi:drug/metabolite transporter (DMT)-like permease
LLAQSGAAYSVPRLMSIPRDKLGLVLGLIGVTIFAGTLPVTKIAVGALDPWFITAARAGIAGVASLVVLLLLRRPVPPRSAWLPLAVIAFALVLGFPALSAFAMRSVPVAHGGVVLGILPLATSMTAVLLARERPSFGFWAAGAAGTALVIVFAIRHGGTGALASGDLILVASIAAAAIGYTLSGRLALTMPGWEVISWACAISLPVSALATFILWPTNAASVPDGAWLAVIFVGLFPQFIGFFAWNAGLALGGIARVGQVQLLQTFMTVALAAIINREAIEAETIAFAAAVVATVMIGRRMPVRR